MKQLLDLYKHILKNGEERADRTGTGTIGVFGYQNRYDLSEGFPLPTTKRTPLRIIFEELNWFIKGSTELADLLDENVHIWDEDAYRDYKSKGGTLSFEEFISYTEETKGYNLGPIYGKQWRSWEKHSGPWYLKETNPIDQIANVIKSIKEDPYGRRHIVSAWNVADLDDMALPPCHLLFQFYVTTDGRLSCQLYQRSADSFLGVPFNIASYALLIHMIAHVTGLKVGEFVHTFGDAHIYKNHLEQVELQLTREPKPLPTLEIIREVKDINDFKWEDFELRGYDPHPPIKGKVSVGT